MGLLDKAIARNNADVDADTGAVSPDIFALIADFHGRNPLFHCIVLQAGEEKGNELVKNCVAMLAAHNAVCADLPSDRCLILLPGELDMELFAHRLSHSTGSMVLFQSSANVYSIVIEALVPYLR